MIVYTIVCRASDARVLAEWLDRDVKNSNCAQVTVELLRHLSLSEAVKDGDLKTFVQRNDTKDFVSHLVDKVHWVCGGEEEYEDDTGEHYFHLYRHGGVFYCCLGDDPDSRDQKV